MDDKLQNTITPHAAPDDRPHVPDHPELPVRIHRLGDGNELLRLPTAFDDVEPLLAAKTLKAMGIQFDAVEDGGAVIVMTTGLRGHGLPEVCLAVMLSDFSKEEAATLLGYAVSTDESIFPGDVLVIDVIDKRSVTMLVTATPQGDLLIVQDRAKPVLAPASATLH